MCLRKLVCVCACVSAYRNVFAQTCVCLCMCVCIPKCVCAHVYMCVHARERERESLRALTRTTIKFFYCHPSHEKISSQFSLSLRRSKFLEL